MSSTHGQSQRRGQWDGGRARRGLGGPNVSPLDRNSARRARGCLHVGRKLYHPLIHLRPLQSSWILHSDAVCRHRYTELDEMALQRLCELKRATGTAPARCSPLRE